MKTYESIKNTAQVQEGDTLVSFYPNSNNIWHRFTVLTSTSERIELLCPSNAVIYINNERLSTEKKYFKRAY